ncbi:hypothetical protein [Paraburkholderia phytofirmans]|uniref:nuclear transport factor 2 family protein n=1 Tax=Paraburkholderia phytofirmans TaxID=261302 RepID=UPI0015E87FAE|nr:hypothetical protein [Paraburkholderia phytofirmans]
MNRDHVLQVLDTIYEKIFNKGQANLYPDFVSGPYIQHNPLFPDGLDGILGYIKQAGRIPCEVKRIAIDGDLAFVHVRYRLLHHSVRSATPTLSQRCQVSRTLTPKSTVSACTTWKVVPAPR